MVRVDTGYSTAEIYLHGAHVTHFQRTDEKPLLFMSRDAVFEAGKPIRGGVPLILPWFGSIEGKGMHGFARTQPWSLTEVASSADDTTRLRFRLPQLPEAAEWPKFVAEFEVFVGDTLEMELTVANVDASRSLEIETCLHTYFAVGDITQTEVTGLKGVKYLDALDGMKEKTEAEAGIKFTGEVDRGYFDSPQTTEIVDRSWGRVIEVVKSESLSTVVWNPWIEKSKRLTDFADDEYQRMVCVESGNVKQNKSRIPPGQVAAFSVLLDSRAL